MQRDSIIFPAELTDAAWRLADVLDRQQTKIVFAESCTAGLVSASLAIVPGISKWLCGSAVTYQEATKVGWLGIQPQDLDDFTAVSPQVALSMVVGVLRATPHADLAVSVTGHLGPLAPPELDGVIFIGTAIRTLGSESNVQSAPLLGAKEENISCFSPNNSFDSGPAVRIKLRQSQRPHRQVEAAVEVLKAAQTLVQKRD